MERRRRRRAKKKLRGSKKWILMMMVVLLAVGCSVYAFDTESVTRWMGEKKTEAPEGDMETAEQVEAEGTADWKTGLPLSHIIDNFEITLQMPELPTGCEVTALTMVLNYYGYDVDKEVMAAEYLPVLESLELYEGGDGRTYGPDLNSFFIGNPFSENGIICGTTAITEAANRYLADRGSSLRASDKSGIALTELYSRISQDQPVVVWVTIGMEDRFDTEGWYTEDGEYVDWSQNDHGAVLIGYTEDTVIIADPISGRTEYSRAQFEKVFRSRNCQCVALE